jgi:predicted deacylase
MKRNWKEHMDKFNEETQAMMRTFLEKVEGGMSNKEAALAMGRSVSWPYSIDAQIREKLGLKEKKERKTLKVIQMPVPEARDAGSVKIVIAEGNSEEIKAVLASIGEVFGG